jgi:hypothetical protein
MIRGSMAGRRLRAATVAVSLVVFGSACSGISPTSGLYINDTAYQQTWLPFLQTGKTTKSEVESALGAPHHEFESGRIWAYGLVGSWVIYDNPEYSLILVFDSNSLLQKHSLVRVRHKQMSG